MGGLVEYAKRELALASGHVADDDFNRLMHEMNENIIEMIAVFEKYGDSGMSAGIHTDRLTRLLKYRPLTPLTGQDDEWNEVSNGLYQNKRCSAVFREKRYGGKAYYLDGRIFSDNGGKTWFTNGNSRVVIKKFPWMPPEKPKRIILNRFPGCFWYLVFAVKRVMRRIENSKDKEVSR